MESISQFDDQDAKVPRHSDDHLANRLGLCRRTIGNAIELRHAVDEVGNFVTEVQSQLMQRVFGVLDSVVEERCTYGRAIETEFDQDLGDGDRMRDVGIT
jgi:hypothetical protein